MLSENCKIIVIEGNKNKELDNLKGIIVDIRREKGIKYYGVELENNLYLHDCNGKCEPGHGYYFKENEIKKFNDYKYQCRLTKRNDELFILCSESFEYNGIKIKLVKHGIIEMIKMDGKIKLAIRNKNNIVKNSISNDCERYIVLHMLEKFNLLGMQSIDSDYNFYEYSEEKAKEVEARYASENVVENTETTNKEIENKKEEYFETEEEVLKSLGIK